MRERNESETKKNKAGGQGGGRGEDDFDFLTCKCLLAQQRRWYGEERTGGYPPIRQLSQSVVGSPLNWRNSWGLGWERGLLHGRPMRDNFPPDGADLGAQIGRVGALGGYLQVHIYPRSCSRAWLSPSWGRSKCVGHESHAATAVTVTFGRWIGYFRSSGLSFSRPMGRCPSIATRPVPHYK